MSGLKEREIGKVRAVLAGGGISHSGLLDELTDHVCCELEEQMDQGMSFDEAFERIAEENRSFTGVKEIQHERDLMVNLRYQQMKKLMYVFGLLSTVLILCGTLFKINHWPGAGKLLLLGTFFTVLGFLPLFFISQYREHPEGRNLYLYITGFLALFFTFLGALFKIQHWPGTGMVLTAGHIMLLLFLPVYFFLVFRKSSKMKVSYSLILLLVVFASMLYSLIAVRVGKNIIIRYEQGRQEAITLTAFYSERNLQLLERIEKQAGEEEMERAKGLRESTDRIMEEIESLKQALLGEVNGKESTATLPRQKDDMKSVVRVIFEQGQGLQLEAALKAYRESVSAYIEDPLLEKLFSQRFETDQVVVSDGETIPWLAYYFDNIPVMTALYHLSRFEEYIGMTEYEILNHWLIQE